MDAEHIETLSRDIEALLDQGRRAELERILDAHHPADIADAIERLPEELRTEVFSLLGHDQAGDVLMEADEATRGGLVEDMEVQALSQVVQTMPPDEAADIVAELPGDQGEQLLDHLPDEASQPIEHILKYDPESAGGIMTPVLIRVEDSMTVGQAIEAVQAEPVGDESEAHFYIYVVDAGGKLAGVVRIRKLLLSRPDTPIASILEPRVASVPVHADQEEIAELFQRYDYLAMPVVDERGVLLGRVTIDDVVDVMEDEVTEDVYKMAGTDDSELATHSVFKIARIRMGWLFACLGGTMVSGVVIRTFEMTLGQTLGLIAFVPAVMAVGGSSGVQTSTVTVRSIATGDMDHGRVLAALFRELRVALVVGAACALVAGTIARLWMGEGSIGLVVGLAMWWSISFAATLGTLLPIIFRSTGIDPAVACGPLITTTNDVASLTVYLVLARLIVGA